jgi:hypothetical protein
LEALHPELTDEVVPELAHHFEAAADWRRAVQYLRLAADIARRRFAHLQAESLLKRALELARRLLEAERAPKELELIGELAANRAAVMNVRETCEALGAAQHDLIDRQALALVDVA